MKTKPIPDTDYLHECFRYEDGSLWWKQRPEEHFKTGGKTSRSSLCHKWNARYAGKQAFTAIEKRDDGRPGYYVGRIGDIGYKAHRIIYKMFHGTEPENIDHLNGNPLDNRIENLASATIQENARNMRRRTTSIGRVPGVRYREDKGRWAARIRVSYKEIFLGYFDTKEQAISARRDAEVQHGFSQNHMR